MQASDGSRRDNNPGSDRKVRRSCPAQEAKRPSAHYLEQPDVVAALA